MHEGHKVGVEIKLDSDVGCVWPVDKSSLEFVQVDDPECIMGALVSMVNALVIERDVDGCAGENDGAADVGDRRQRCEVLLQVFVSKDVCWQTISSGCW